MFAALYLTSGRGGGPPDTYEGLTKYSLEAADDRLPAGASSSMPP
jgi:hypothetical protein